MVAFKLVIGTKEGRTVQKELQEPNTRAFLGKKIGDIVKGEDTGIAELAGYELMIAGGSDYCGFPMRQDVPGLARKRILAVSGIGMHKISKGMKQRKTVCGNTIHPKISQINLKVVKAGPANIAPPVEKKKKAENESAAEQKPAA
jgi:small subunit ribosomal protein S6e